jgi:hypothetical protein
MICLLSLSCTQNKVTNSDLARLFPNKKNPEILQNSFSLYHVLNTRKHGMVTKISGDFNHDKTPDLAVICREEIADNPDSLNYFFAIISLPENKEPGVDLLIDSIDVNEDMNGLTIDKDDNIYVPDCSWSLIQVKWINNRYETTYHNDVSDEDASLSIHFSEIPEKPSVLIYLSKKHHIQQIEWSGYDPSHKKSPFWTYFTEYDSMNIIYSPDMSFDWNDTFSCYDEIKLLLVTDCPYIDSLANNHYGTRNTKSIEEYMDIIGKDSILKVWDIKKLKPHSDNWYLSYP